MREPDDFDSLLNSSLSSYGDPGANSGLEERVTARIFAARSSHRKRALRRGLLPWVIALPVAACLLVLVFTQHRETPPGVESLRPGPTTPFQSAQTHPPRLLNSPAAHAGNTRISNSASPRSVPRLSKRNESPKLDIFPTPQPLAPEERALEQFVSQASPDDLKVLIAAKQQTEAPLKIAAIQIRPIEPTQTDQN